MIWAILAVKNENKVYVNQDESLTDLQTLIKYSFLLNFLHESLMNLIKVIYHLNTCTIYMPHGCVWSYKLKSNINLKFAPPCPNFRILFPSLPNEEFVHVGVTAAEESAVSNDKIIDSNALLGPLMFPRFYPPLFTLYALHNEKNDSAYWERIHQLNKRTDLALMSYLEIKR